MAGARPVVRIRTPAARTTRRENRRTHEVGIRPPSGSSTTATTIRARTAVNRSTERGRAARDLADSTQAPGVHGALGSQTLFDAFKANTKPETSWTYEFGARTQHELHLGPITGFEGQLSYYHVNFQNRLLAVSPTQTITAIVSGATIINNVGGVTTDGVDIAGTLHFGPHFSFYDALSYNNSAFDDNYVTGSGASQTTVLTKGKKVPGSPDWLNKFIASANYGIFDVQLVGDYMGKRYATYTNDLHVPGYFTMSARLGAKVPLGANSVIHELNLSLNVTNLTDKKAASTLSIGAASGTYNYYPVAPREVFGTIGFKF